MQTSEQGLTLIKKFENFSAKSYICPAGKPTIGYGHVIVTGEEFSIGEIDLNMAEVLLKQDVMQREQAINCLIQVTLLQNQFDAIISFVYNVGVQAFDKSTLLSLINQNDILAAAEQFGRWIYVNGVVSSGFISRRAAEKVVFTTP